MTSQINSFEQLNSLFNSFFDGKITLSTLEKRAVSSGFGHHPLLKEVLLRNTAEKEVSAKPKSLKSHIVTSSGIDVRGMSCQRVTELATTIITQEKISSLKEKAPPAETSEAFCHARGLRNYGNTCFANAALSAAVLENPSGAQMVAVTLQRQRGESSEHFNLRQTLQTNMRNLFTEYKKPAPSQELISRHLLAVISSPLFAQRGLALQRRQEDSFEFLIALSDFLEFEKASASQFIRCDTIVDAAGERTHAQPAASYVQTSAVIAPGSSVESLVAQSLAPEITLAGRTQTAHIECENVENISSMSISLLRFNQDRSKNQSILDDPTAPFTMQVFDRATGRERVLLLTPKSAICHLGATQEYGHYVSIVRNGDAWQERSDAFVRDITAADAARTMAPNAYIITYEVSAQP